MTYRAYDSTAPTHFFGELTKTPEGCQMLRERGIVSDFAELVRLNGLEAEDEGVLTNVKTVLWALVSSSDFGKIKLISV
jgi:rapamycin-insensitive companion of mTOR